MLLDVDKKQLTKIREVQQCRGFLGRYNDGEFVITTTETKDGNTNLVEFSFRP